jgi:hypothetical protein
MLGGLVKVVTQAIWLAQAGGNVATRIFISFDYDNDSDLKTLLVGQAKNPDSPFEIADWSIKDPSADWKVKARERIKRSDQVVVICGLKTDTATGVAVELGIAQEETKPYFLLWGRVQGTCKKPTTAKDSDKIYKWTWEGLKVLVGGAR